MPVDKPIDNSAEKADKLLSAVPKSLVPTPVVNQLEKEVSPTTAPKKPVVDNRLELLRSTMGPEPTRVEKSLANMRASFKRELPVYKDAPKDIDSKEQRTIDGIKQMYTRAKRGEATEKEINLLKYYEQKKNEVVKRKNDEFKLKSDLNYQINNALDKDLAALQYEILGKEGGEVDFGDAVLFSVKKKSLNSLRGTLAERLKTADFNTLNKQYIDILEINKESPKSRNLANLVKGYADMAFIKEKLPNVSLSNLVLNNKKLDPTLAPQLYSTVIDSGLYGEGELDDYLKDPDFQKSEAGQRIGYEADLYLQKTLGGIVNKEREKATLELINLNEYIQKIEKTKGNPAKEKEQADGLVRQLTLLDEQGDYLADINIEKRLAKDFPEWDRKIQQKRAEELIYNTPTSFADVLLVHQISGFNPLFGIAAYTGITQDAVKRGQDFMVAGQKIANSFIDLAAFIGGSYGDESAARKWQKNVSYFQPGFTIGTDADGNPVSSGEFYWRDKNGNINTNFIGGMIQTGIPVAAQFAETILLTRGLGAIGNATLRGIGYGAARGSELLSRASKMANVAFRGPSAVMEAGTLGRTGAAALNATRGTKFAKQAQALLSAQVAPRLNTFASVFMTTYPTYYYEEYGKFKNRLDARNVAILRGSVEALSESIIPNTTQLFTRGARFLGFGRRASVSAEADAALEGTIRGLFPGMTNKTLRRILDARGTRRFLGITSDLFQEGFIEEEAALFGNAWVDTQALDKNVEYVPQNELSAENIWKTAIESTAAMLLTAPFMGGGSKRADNRKIADARFTVATNPEYFKSFLAQQVKKGNITTEQFIERAAKVDHYSAQLRSLPAKMGSIRNLSNLLEDTEMQSAYFAAHLEREKLLQYTPTEEEKDAYFNELERLNNSIKEVEKVANIYENMTIQEKEQVVASSLKENYNFLMEHEDLSPAVLEAEIARKEKEIKKNPHLYAKQLGLHIKELKASKEQVKNNFFQFILNNNTGLTFEQLDYKISLLGENKDYFDEKAYQGLTQYLAMHFVAATAPLNDITDEAEYVEALAKNYVTAKHKERPLVSNGKPLLRVVQDGYVNNYLFDKFVKGLEGKAKDKKLDELKTKFWNRVVQLRETLKPEEVFPEVPVTPEDEAPVTETTKPVFEDLFNEFNTAISQVKGDAETTAAERSRIKAEFIGKAAQIVLDTAQNDQDVFDRLGEIFQGMAPEESAALLEQFKKDYTAGTLGRGLTRFFGKGLPANFINNLKNKFKSAEEGGATETTATEETTTQEKKAPSIEGTLYERLEEIEQAVNKLLSEESIEKERLAFLDILLEQAKSVLEEQTKGVQEAIKALKTISAPKGTKRAQNIEARRAQLQTELRAVFNTVQSITDRIREVEENLKRLEGIRQDLQSKSEVYKNLVATGQTTTEDVWNRISYLDSKVRNLNTLIDKAKDFIERLKNRLAYIAQVLTGQRGFLEEGVYASKEQVNELAKSIDFADATEAELNKKETEVRNLTKAAQDAERQIEYLLQLFMPSKVTDSEILEVKPANVIPITPVTVEAPTQEQVKPKGSPKTSKGFTKKQLSVAQKLTENPNSTYVVTLNDGSTITGTQFKKTDEFSLEGVNTQGEKFILPISSLKSARKINTRVLPTNPNIEDPEVITDEEDMMTDWVEKDARRQFPQSGFITSSDEFDFDNEVVEDDYSQAINAIFKAMDSFPGARISSMETYLNLLLGPDGVARISSVIDSEESEENKLAQLEAIFTEYNKLVFYRRTLARWASNRISVFNEDLKAPAFYVVDEKGKLLRYNTKGLDQRGYPIHRNLPLVGVRKTNKFFGSLDYKAIKVDLRDATIQAALAKMEDIRKKIKENPSLVYNVSEVVVSPGALMLDKGTLPFTLVPTGTSPLVIVGTDISETAVDFPKGYVLGEYEGEFMQVRFPKLTESQVDMITALVNGVNLPTELESPENRLRYINAFVYTNPYNKNNKIAFSIQDGKIVVKYNDTTLNEKELKERLRNSYLNFSHGFYNNYTPLTIYQVTNGKFSVVENTDYSTFINKNTNFAIPNGARINRKLYFGTPVTPEEQKADKEVVYVEQVSEDEPFVDGSNLLDFGYNGGETTQPEVEELTEAENTVNNVVEDLVTQEDNFPFTEDEDTEGDVDDFVGLWRERGLPQNVSQKQAQEALEWFQNSELSPLVSLNRMFNLVNSKAYASFVKGAVTLYQGSTYADLYHEGWHIFSQYFLTRKQKINLYNEVKKKLGNATFLEAEEYLAERFRGYALAYKGKQPKNSVEKIFYKIYNFLQRMFNNSEYNITQMFEKLYTGNINEYAPSESNFMFKELLSGKPNSLTLKTAQGATEVFSDRDLNELVSNLDATIVHQVFDKIAEETKRRFSLTTALANKRNKATSTKVYSILKSILQSNLDALKKDNKPSYAPMIQRYEAILNDWNKVVSMHSKRSPVFTEYSADTYEFVLDETQNSEDASKDFAFDRSIEEFSSISRAKPEVIALVASMGKMKGGKLEKGKLLGLPVLDNFTKNWKILSKTLAGITDYAHILYKIENLAKEMPEFNYLLESLPKNNQPGIGLGEINLKNAFISTFSEPIVEMMKVRLNKEVIDNPEDPGNPTIKINPAVVKAESRASRIILKEWSMRFKTEGTAFTKKTDAKQAIQLTKLAPAKEAVKAIKNIDDKVQAALELAGNMGLYLEPNVIESFTTLLDKTKFVDSIIEFSNNLLALAGEVGMVNDPVTQLDTSRKIPNTLKYLVELALKNQDEFFNDEASNPEGNYIFKKNQFHYISKVFSWFNEPHLRVKEKYKGKDITNLPVSETHEEYYPNLGDMFVLHPELSYLNPAVDAFSFGSAWLSRLYTSDGVRIMNSTKTAPETIIRVSHFGGTEYEDNNKLEGKKTTKLVSVDKLLTDINGFLLKGIQENIRFADKGSAYTIHFDQTLDVIYDQNVENRNKSAHNAITPFTSDAWKSSMYPLIDHAIAEVLAINQARNLAQQNLSYKNYDTNGKKFRLFEEIFSPEVKEFLTSEAFQDQIDSLGSMEDKANFIEEALDDLKAIDQISSYIEKEASNLDSYIKDELSLTEDDIAEFYRELFPSNGKFEQFTTDQLLLAYTYYDTVHRIQQFKFLYRDPAFFKNTEEVFKRLAKYSATGNYLNTSPDFLNQMNSDPLKGRKLQEASTGKAQPYTNQVNSTIVQDELVDSNNKEEYIELLKSSLNLIEEQPKEVLAGYGTTNKGGDRADAQGISTLDFYRFAKTAVGKWLPEQEVAYFKEVEIYKEYQKYKASLNNPAVAQEIARKIVRLIEEQSYEMVTKGDRTQVKEKRNYVFEPWKPQYAGPIVSKLPAAGYHKFSIYPATPSMTIVLTVNSIGEIVIEENDLYAIAENMYRSNVDYLIMGSGVKSSAEMQNGEYYSLFDNSGNVNQAPLPINALYGEFFKEQVPLDPHEGIQSIIFPTQFRGLLFLDEAEKGKFFDKNTKKLYNEYRKLINELIAVEKNKLKNELGATKNDFSDVSTKDLAAFLTREMEAKDVSSDVFSFFVTKKGEFVFNYNGSTERRAITSVLEGIVYNRIIKQKLSGTHYVQGADLGHTNFTKPTQAQIKAIGTKGMRFYSKDYQYCDVKIAFSARYRPLLNIVWKGQKVGNLAKLNSLLKDEEFMKAHGDKFTLVGCRVPTQGINSMERMRVFEFLPPSAGSLMILPQEIIVKTGSDFDIDKMFVFEPSFDKEGNYYEYIGVEEEIKLREEVEVTAKEYNSKKRKLVFQIKNLRKRITKEEDLKVFDALSKQFAIDLANLERGLAAQDVQLKEGEDLTVEEQKEIEQQSEQAVKQIFKEGADPIERLKTLYAEISTIKSILIEATDRLKSIKKGRSNAFVKLISTRLGNPDILYKLILPNENPDLQRKVGGESLPDYFNNKTKYVSGEKKSWTDLIKAVVSNQVFKAFMVGKATLGIAARMNKTHQTTAQMNLNDTNERPYLLKTNNGNSLSMLFDTKGRPISRIFSQYINGLVDGAKGAWIALLGVDKQKGPIQMYIVKRGTAVEDAIAFTLQQSIHQYTKNLTRNNSIFIKALGLSVDKSTERQYTLLDLLQNTQFQDWMNMRNGEVDVWSTVENILYYGTQFNPKLDSINVWSTSDTEYKDLSNMSTKFPFQAAIGSKTYKFNSVEQYYHAVKAYTFRDKASLDAILKEPNPFNALQLGRQVQNFKDKVWAQQSTEVMFRGLQASIEQNPDKKALLLKTGEARITHINPKGGKNRWEVEFPAILMDIRNQLQPLTYSPFEFSVLNEQLDVPTLLNQLIYLAQYIALEKKSSNFVNFDQLYSPDTTKETNVMQIAVNKGKKEKLKDEFSGLDTFSETTISAFEGLVNFSLDLQLATNDLLSNPEVLNALTKLMSRIESSVEKDGTFDFKKVGNKMMDSLVQFILHNYYRLDNGDQLFKAYQLGTLNISPLSVNYADNNLATLFRNIIKDGKKLKVDLTKEYPVIKYLKTHFRPESLFFSYIFTAGTRLTSMQKDEFKADLVKLTQFTHENQEFAASVREFFTDFLNIMYVSTGFQYFEGNTAPIIPSMTFQRKATNAINEFLEGDIEGDMEVFAAKFFQYNYSYTKGERISETQRSFNIYNKEHLNLVTIKPEVELKKGMQYFINALTALEDNSVYLQLIEKRCD